MTNTNTTTVNTNGQRPSIMDQEDEFNPNLLWFLLIPAIFCIYILVICVRKGWCWLCLLPCYICYDCCHSRKSKDQDKEGEDEPEICVHSPQPLFSTTREDQVSFLSTTEAYASWATRRPRFGSRRSNSGQLKRLETSQGVSHHNFHTKQRPTYASVLKGHDSRLNQKNWQSSFPVDDLAPQTPRTTLNQPGTPLSNQEPSTPEQTPRRNVPSSQIRKRKRRRSRKQNVTWTYQREQINFNLKPRSHILASNDCLTIAVDATPHHIGGYCINPFRREVHYYSVPSTHMPWTLVNKTIRGNPQEFEMKNLMCSLLLWINLMKVYKSVIIYTDNPAITRNSRHTERILSLLHHLQKCEQVEIKNLGSMFLNSREDSELFRAFIIPADHLSRRRVISFKQDLNAGPLSPNTNNEGWYKLADFNQVRQAVLRWRRQTCKSCGFGIGFTTSLNEDYHHQ